MPSPKLALGASLLLVLGGSSLGMGLLGGLAWWQWQHGVSSPAGAAPEAAPGPAPTLPSAADVLAAPSTAPAPAPPAAEAPPGAPASPLSDAAPAPSSAPTSATAAPATAPAAKAPRSAARAPKEAPAAEPPPEAAAPVAEPSRVLLTMEVKRAAKLKGATYTLDGSAVSVPGQRALTVGIHTFTAYKDGVINWECRLAVSDKDLTLVVDPDNPRCP